jgi:cystathionine beta-lyase family protein involved in aluminum resistance
LQHFAGTTGYGHNDAGGREALDLAFADVVGSEAAIVRSQVLLSTEPPTGVH